MPTLGSSNRKTVRSRVSARPSITFWRLPPESTPAARSMLGGLSCSCSMMVVIVARSEPCRSTPKRAKEGRSSTVIEAFSRIGRDNALQTSAWGRVLVGRTVNAHDAAGDRLEPIDRADQLRLAAADKACDAGDLAGPGVEVHVANAAVDQREVLDVDQNLARLVLDRWKEQVDLATGHQFDQFAVGRCGGIEGADVAAVAQHGYAVGERADLAHAMRDVDEADVLPLQPGDQFEQPASLALGQRGGRLVEDEQTRPAKQSLGDLGHLLVRA